MWWCQFSTSDTILKIYEKFCTCPGARKPEMNVEIISEEFISLNHCWNMSPITERNAWICNVYSQGNYFQYLLNWKLFAQCKWDETRIWKNVICIDRIIWRNINGIRSFNNYWSLLWGKGGKSCIHPQAKPCLPSFCAVLPFCSFIPFHTVSSALDNVLSVLSPMLGLSLLSCLFSFLCILCLLSLLLFWPTYTSHLSLLLCFSHLCLDEKQSIYGLHPFFTLVQFAWRSYTLPISIPCFNHIQHTLLPYSASSLTLKMEYISSKC